MKAILMSIQPKWCELIASGKKTVEVRKTAPKEVPFKCYIYATKPKKWFRFSSWGYASDESLWLSNGKVKMCDGFEFWADGKEYEPLCGKVIGEFTCDKVEECIPDYNPATQEFFYNEWADCSASCLTSKEEAEYGKGKPLYGLHISKLKIYDKPKELGEFKIIKCTNKRGSCSDCDIKPNCLKYLTRPPQSWQYIEPLDK